MTNRLETVGNKSVEKEDYHQHHRSFVAALNAARRQPAPLFMIIIRGTGFGTPGENSRICGRETLVESFRFTCEKRCHRHVREHLA
jgi:hypothetical protein